MSIQKFVRNLRSVQLPFSRRYKRNFSSESLASSKIEAATTSNPSLKIEEFRQHQLTRLESVKPSDFSPSVLNQIIADFLVSTSVPDIKMASVLIDKFLFKIPGVDEEGDLSSLYLLYLIQAKETAKCSQFLQSILNAKEPVKIRITPFMFEIVWKTFIELKDDVSAFSLLKASCETSTALDEHMTGAFKNRTIVELFLPRLNWEAIDFIVAQSSVESGQITVSSQTLEEIFHVLLSPSPGDAYIDPIDAEPYSANIVNPRFHRLIQVLERWKHSGIPIKGKQIAAALEENFKRFLPTESMMKELQKLL